MRRENKKKRKKGKKENITAFPLLRSGYGYGYIDSGHVIDTAGVYIYVFVFQCGYIEMI